MRLWFFCVPVLDCNHPLLVSCFVLAAYLYNITKIFVNCFPFTCLRDCSSFEFQLNIYLSTLSKFRESKEIKNLSEELGIIQFEALQILRKKCPYLELFWSAFSRIWTEFSELQSISPYSVRMWENADLNNSKYGHFPRSEMQMFSKGCTLN